MIVIPVLTSFGYLEKDLKRLSSLELEELYDHVSSYVWARLFKEFKSSDQPKFSQVKSAIESKNYSELLKVVPDFYDLVKKYGREFNS